MAKRNLRRKPVPNPPPSAGQQSAAPQQPANRPPIKTGELIMTDWMREQLEALGWKEGDPLPGDMDEIYQRAREVVEEEVRNARPDVPEDHKPHIPDVIQLEDLPPDKQQEIRQSLDRARRQQQQIEQQEAQQQQTEQMTVPGADPSVNDSIRRLAQTQPQQPQDQQPQQPQNQEEPPGVYLRDDTEEALGQQSQQPQQPKQPQQPRQDADAGDKQEKDQAPSVGAGITHCPRCDWNLNLPYQLEVSEADKNGWVTAMLGGKRFYKQFDILGGRAQVIFRTLTSQESRLIAQQLSYDVANNPSMGQAELLANLSEYRFALSLQQLVMGDKPAGPPACELHEIEWDRPAEGEAPRTVLPILVEDINQNVVRDESIKRVVNRKLMQFQGLVDKLEAMADDPDF